MAWLAVGIGAEIAFAQKLKMTTVHRIGQSGFGQCIGDDVKRVGINIVLKITFFRGRILDLKQSVVFPYFAGNGRFGIHPMQGSLHFETGGIRTAFAFRNIAAVYLKDGIVFSFYLGFALNDVGAFQTDHVSGSQAEEFFRWILHEIFLLDPQFF